MPKTNDGGGATYAGYAGIVEHAGGAGSTRPGGLSELDPERNLDGTLIEGEHPDREEGEEHAPEAAKRGEESGNEAPKPRAKRS